MTGRKFKLGVAACALALMTGTAGAADYTWKIQGIAPETSLYHKLFIEKFAAHVEALSGGAIDIQAFGGGVLAPATQLHDAVQSGVLEAAIAAPGYLVNKDPVNSYFSAHPGGMDGMTLYAWYNVGGGEALLQKHRRENMDLQAFLCGVGPAEVFMHAHKKVENAEDLKDMKIRASGSWAEILGTHFGGVPTTVPGSEIYALLERKAIDGAEFSTIADNLKLGFHEAAPYMIVPGMHVRGWAMELIMTAERWDGLPENIQSAVKAACALTSIQSFTEWSALDIAAVEGLSDEDRERVVRISDDLLEKVVAAGRDWGEKRAKDNAFMQEVIASYYGFMKNWGATSAFRGQ